MKKCEEKAPMNEAAALREMMIKNFGGGHHNEALPRGSGVRKEVSHEKGQAVRGRTCE